MPFEVAPRCFGNAVIEAVHFHGGLQRHGFAAELDDADALLCIDTDDFAEGNIPGASFFRQNLYGRKKLPIRQLPHFSARGFRAFVEGMAGTLFPGRAHHAFHQVLDVIFRCPANLLGMGIPFDQHPAARFIPISTLCRHDIYIDFL